MLVAVSPIIVFKVVDVGQRRFVLGGEVLSIRGGCFMFTWLDTRNKYEISLVLFLVISMTVKH
jgi:hypothetical protein